MNTELSLMESNDLLYCLELAINSDKLTKAMHSRLVTLRNRLQTELNTECDRVDKLSGLHKATHRLLDSVWTIAYRVIDGKATIVSYSRKDAAPVTSLAMERSPLFHPFNF